MDQAVWSGLFEGGQRESRTPKIYFLLSGIISIMAGIISGAMIINYHLNTVHGLIIALIFFIISGYFISSGVKGCKETPVFRLGRNYTLLNPSHSTINTAYSIDYEMVC